MGNMGNLIQHEREDDDDDVSTGASQTSSEQSQNSAAAAAAPAAATATNSQIVAAEVHSDNIAVDASPTRTNQAQKSSLEEKFPQFFEQNDSISSLESINNVANDTYQSFTDFVVERGRRQNLPIRGDTASKFKL